MAIISGGSVIITVVLHTGSCSLCYLLRIGATTRQNRDRVRDKGEDDDGSFIVRETRSRANFSDR